MATEVLVAVAVCILLAPGVILDYSDDSSYIPSYVGSMLPPFVNNPMSLLSMASIKHAVVVALALSVANFGIAALFRILVKSVKLE